VEVVAVTRVCCSGKAVPAVSGPRGERRGMPRAMLQRVVVQRTPGKPREVGSMYNE